MALVKKWVGMASSLVLAACAVPPPKPGEQNPVPLVSSVDLPRFMGCWYVISVIPTFVEKGAHNSKECYRLQEDGRIATTFTRRDGSFDAPEKTSEPIATVVPGTGNALWGMQFIWPIQGEFRIAYVREDYGVTIIARSKRDYVWLMARDPSLPAAEVAQYREMIASWGYDVSKLEQVPQRW